jgi:hypothetical protein
VGQTKRHLRLVTGVAATAEALPDFEVRFSPTAALTTRLHRPANSFRWIGPGRLLVNRRGMLVTARSATLFGLRPSQRFIPAADIQDVYREANAVQVHVRGPRHPYFRFWTEDAAAAARIVALLPTSRTIEFETVLEEPPAPRRWRRPLAWLLALLLAVTLLGVLAWLSGFLNGQPRASAPRPHPAPATTVTTRPLPQVAPEDALRTRVDVVKYDERVQALRVEFDIAFEALMEGKVTQPAFIEQLQQWQLPQWDLLELELRRTRAPPGSLQERADQHILATINNWQLALRSYTDDLRRGRQVADAFEYLRRADAQRTAAARLLDNLGRPATAGPQSPP